MENVRVGVSFGSDTTSEMREVLSELDDKFLDELQVEWDPPKSPGLAGEPLTAYVILTGSAIAISAILRVVERHMDHQQQREMMRLVAEGFEIDPKLGEQLKIMSEKFSDVSISHGLVREAWPPADT